VVPCDWDASGNVLARDWLVSGCYLIVRCRTIPCQKSIAADQFPARGSQHAGVVVNMVSSDQEVVVNEGKSVVGG
jgi:hypothetical protein